MGRRRPAITKANYQRRDRGRLSIIGLTDFLEILYRLAPVAPRTSGSNTASAPTRDIPQGGTTAWLLGLPKNL